MVIFQYYSRRQWQIELINSRPEIYYGKLIAKPLKGEEI